MIIKQVITENDNCFELSLDRVYSNGVNYMVHLRAIGLVLV